MQYGKTSPSLAEVVAALPAHRSIRAKELPDRYRKKLWEAEDCGLVVNRSGWWDRTTKGTDWLANKS